MQKNSVKYLLESRPPVMKDGCNDTRASQSPLSNRGSAYPEDITFLTKPKSIGILKHPPPQVPEQLKYWHVSDRYLRLSAVKKSLTSDIYLP